MAKPFPLQPARPERICWGCDRYCSADELACGNGSGRVMHPIETQGEDWYLLWGIEPEPQRPGHAKTTTAHPSTLERAAACPHT